jgi:lipoate-protein ligase B
MAELQQIWWGRISYAEAHQRMLERLEARLHGEVPDALLLCEHDPVYTVGRQREAMASVLDPGEVPVIPVERGGNVTFHGPGQLTGYPVVALPAHRRDVHEWLRGLEAFFIGWLAEQGISASRDERNTGVWVEGRKIVALGVALRQWVSWHGFALNLDVDLAWYRRINPCGMGSELVTRLADHQPACPGVEQAQLQVGEAFARWWQRWAAPA